MLAALLAQGAPDHQAAAWWESSGFVIGLAVVAVVSLIVTIWALRVAYRPRPVIRRLRYRVESTPLVDPRLHGSGIQIRDELGNELERVTATSIDVVNSGPSAIRGAEIVAGRRGFPAGLVFDVAAGTPMTVLRVEMDLDNAPYVDPAARVTTLDGEDYVCVEFNILEPGDGLRVVLLHDGGEIDSVAVAGHLPDGSIVEGGAQGRAQFFELVAQDVAEISIGLPFFGSIKIKRHERPASRWPD